MHHIQATSITTEVRSSQTGKYLKLAATDNNQFQHNLSPKKNHMQTVSTVTPLQSSKSGLLSINSTTFANDGGSASKYNLCPIFFIAALVSASGWSTTG